MFRRDPLQLALREAADLLQLPQQGLALLPAARQAYRLGGVLGVSNGREQRLFPLGNVPPDGVFELASVSKPFTAVLADALIRAGKLGWNTPLYTLGGALRRLPRHLTPLRLATHTAGLPMHPARAAVTSFTSFHDPYGSLSPADALASARRWARDEQPPRFLYSNLGVGVLGLAMAFVAGEELSAWGYERALQEWVTGPLNLPSIGLSPDPARPGPTRPDSTRLVAPRGLLGGSDTTHFGALAAAGGLTGSAGDLLTFAGAHLSGQAGQHWQIAATPPGLPAPRRAVSPGWFLSGEPKKPLLWHDGVARGTRSGVGFNPVTGASVAVLVRGGVPLVGYRPAPTVLLLGLLGGPETL